MKDKLDIDFLIKEVTALLDVVEAPRLNDNKETESTIEQERSRYFLAKHNILMEIQKRNSLKEHISLITEMANGDEYKINWIEDSGALITKTEEGFILIDCSYGVYCSEKFYKENEIEKMVSNAMSYT